MKLVTAISAIVFTLAAGCSTTPQQSEPSPEPPSATAELDGNWITTISREQARATLAEHGLEGYADQFFEEENFGDPEIWVYTFSDGAVAGAFRDVGDVWKVGYRAGLTIDGDRAEFHDGDQDYTVTLRWRREGDKLTFTWISDDSPGPRPNGIPQTVYDIALFESVAYEPVDCVAGTQCEGVEVP